jgi:hypothetical protein
MATHLVERALDFKISLGKGSFGESGADTVDLKGHRATAVIAKNGTPSMNSAIIRIFGMTLSKMNQLSRIGTLPTAFRDNTVTVSAGTKGGNDMALVFAGGIQEAWADFQAAPEVGFNIVAHTGLLAQMKKAMPSSYPGNTDVAVIMGQLAKQMGYTFENNGVAVQLRDPYLPGTARVQAIAAADAAGVYLVFDDDKHVMAILPKDGSRGGSVPEISSETGMVGYPMYVGPGQLGLKTEYNPAIRFLGKILVKSSIEPANGEWVVNRLSHDLSSEEPSGPWFTNIQGNLALAGRK